MPGYMPPLYTCGKTRCQGHRWEDRFNCEDAMNMMSGEDVEADERSSLKECPQYYNEVDWCAKKNYYNVFGMQIQKHDTFVRKCEFDYEAFCWVKTHKWHDRCHDGTEVGVGRGSRCSPRHCRMMCPNGFEKDDQGCDTCRCASRARSSDNHRLIRENEQLREANEALMQALKALN